MTQNDFIKNDFFKRAAVIADIFPLNWQDWALFNVSRKHFQFLFDSVTLVSEMAKFWREETQTKQKDIKDIVEKYWRSLGFE